MKKILLLLTIVSFGTANAQVSFKPGVKAGFSASTVTGLGGEYRNSFYLGLYGNLKLTRVYNMQFEMMYLRQGVNDIQSYSYDNYNYQYRPTGVRGDVPLDYLSLNLINKFNFGNFNMHLGPGIDFKVSEHTGGTYYNTNGSYYEPLYTNNSGVDLTFNFGVGYNFNENFGIEARMRQGLIEPIYSNASYYSDYNSNLNRSFMVGVTYTFK